MPLSIYNFFSQTSSLFSGSDGNIYLFDKQFYFLQNDETWKMPKRNVTHSRETIFSALYDFFPQLSSPKMCTEKSRCFLSSIHLMSYQYGVGWQLFFWVSASKKWHSERIITGQKCTLRRAQSACMNHFFNQSKMKILSDNIGFKLIQFEPMEHIFQKYIYHSEYYFYVINAFPF